MDGTVRTLSFSAVAASTIFRTSAPEAFEAVISSASAPVARTASSSPSRPL